MTKSLRERVTQISIFAFVAASLVALTCFVLFSLSKRKLSQSEVEQSLRANAQAQIEQLIPSFLLPEQIAGLDSLLKRVKDTEALTHAESIVQKSQLPDSLKNCELNPNQAISCLSQDGKETAVIFPITEGGRHFGYLMKAKLNTSSWALRDIFQLVGIFALMLVGTFVTVYVFIARILSQKLPRSLDRLVQWIDDDLSDRNSKIESLPFKELEDLKDKITEVMNRHSQARDQAVIGQVTSGIMHDIKTPLQSIVAATHLLKREINTNEKRTRYLENLAQMCEDNVPVIQSIVETTLDGSRKIALNRKRDNLLSTIQRGVELNKNAADLHKVEVKIKGPEFIEVDHDSVQLLRVLQNLVKNAIEATSDGVEQRVVEVSVRKESGNLIRLAVEDSGPGISGSPEKIFRAFKSSKIRGSGLGLLITKKIVEAHGGNITADKSPKYGGARFEVLLPQFISSPTLEISI